jgi:hypothetical protein
MLIISYLSLNEVSNANFCHHRDCNRIDDLLDHFGITLTGSD